MQAMSSRRGLTGRETDGGRYRTLDGSCGENLLGRSVRPKERPEGSGTDTGTIAVVPIDGRGVHFVVLVDGRVIPIKGCDQLTVVD
jgi:hypothetical protein